MSDEPGPEPRKRRTKPKQSKPGSPVKPGRLLFWPCMWLSLPLVLHALHKQLTHATAVFVIHAVDALFASLDSNIQASQVVWQGQ